MGTTVLNDVVDYEKDVWARENEADETKPPKTTLTDAELDEIGISKRDFSKMSLLERSAYKLKLEGHEVYIVDESEDEGFDFRQYIDPKTLAYLDAMTLDENWRDKRK